MSSSKNKRAKKKFRSVGDGGKGATSKIYTYFSHEEISELKATLKTKDISGVPVVVAATVLHKFHILKSLVKDGYNVNQTAQNNMTGLIWAVKLRYTNFVDYLLANGADPAKKSDSGDTVLVLALENKLWDENAFVNLWKLIKKKTSIDFAANKKNGHNLLHMCVRREWENALHLILAEKPKVDDANFNGVTPLMLACFRTNQNIINALMKAGGDILKKDNHGRMAICYLISSSMKSAGPYPALNRVLAELNRKSSFEHYLKGTLDLIVSCAKKQEISASTSGMLTKIVQYAVQYNDGVKILLDYGVFKKMRAIIETQIDNVDSIRFILEIWNEIFFYNKESHCFDANLQEMTKVNFYENNLVEICVQILNLNNPKTDKFAFNLILLSFQDNENWAKILEENTKILQDFANDLNSNDKDSFRSKIIEEQKAKIKVLLNSFNKTEDTQKSSESKSMKKSRRRAKARKAKLSKIKTVELSKRINLNIRKSPPKPNFPLEELTELYPKSANPIVESFQYMLKKPSSSQKAPKPFYGSYTDWKDKIKHTVRTSTSNYPFNTDKVQTVCRKIKLDLYPKPILNTSSINVIVDYLAKILGFLIKKYREHWDRDTHNPCFCPDACKCQLENLEEKERDTLARLRKNFDELISTIKLLAPKNPEKAFQLLNEMEELLLHHEIRKIKLMSYMGVEDCYNLEYMTNNRKFIQQQTRILPHLQNVLNGIEPLERNLRVNILENYDNDLFEEPQTETADEIYWKDMSQLADAPPRSKRAENESRMNTITNAFQLISSTMAICDDSNERSAKRTYSITDLNLKNDADDKTSDYLAKYVPKRLKTQITSLQSSQCFQSLLDGEIRISVKEQRLHYVISAGINFSAVELGLDMNNVPLAVKRIQRQSWVGKTIKTLVDPLLGLIDTNILPYFACEYDGEELILATQLCKWNMAQYLQILRQTSMLPAPLPGFLTTGDVIKQFLNGIMVLHKCEIPIIHGNIKPSNVFIDFGGVVKIAEFGIHKALYKIIEPPKSSLMWFAKETLDIYRNSSTVECSSKSDIQVAGMLIYFIFTCGTHPFGEEIEDIIKNIQASASKIKSGNYDLRNLLTWMMVSNSNERPSIEEVIAHPYFWTLQEKKWNFILACAGTTQAGFLLPLNISKLYRSIDALAEAYIKIDWQAIVRIKLPNVKLNDQNGISGLLRFIRYCYENQDETEINEAELNSVIMSLFPTLAVALYRILVNTNWLKHPIFTQFCRIF